MEEQVELQGCGKDNFLFGGNKKILSFMIYGMAVELFRREVEGVGGELPLPTSR